MSDVCPKCGAERFWVALAEYRCGSVGVEQSTRCKLRVAERENAALRKSWGLRDGERVIDNLRRINDSATETIKKLEAERDRYREALERILAMPKPQATQTLAESQRRIAREALEGKP